MPEAEVTPLKVELRRVICDARLYKDSFPFRAELWIDGVQYGTVDNDNNGGSPIFRDHDGEMKLHEYAQTLPKIRSSCGGHVSEYPASADTIVSDLLTEWIVTQDIRKDMKRNWVYTIKGNDCDVYKTSQATVLTSQMLRLRFKDTVEHVLNLMEPLEAARLMIAYENRKMARDVEKPFVAVDKKRIKRNSKV